MSEPVPRRSLTRGDLEVVIRRAAEIEAQRGSDLPDLSAEDVVRIAHDVGLSEESVRRALAEFYASPSSDGLLAESGLFSRLCGSALVRASRRIPESAEAAKARLENHFGTHESLSLVRSVKWGSLWEPESGVVAAVTRSVDLFGHGYDLAKRARAVEIATVPLSEDESLVTLTADLGGERANWFWGMGIAGGGAATVGASIWIVGLPSLPPLAALAAPVLLGAGLSLARTGYGKLVQKTRRTLEGLLDRLEHGEPLEKSQATWRDLLK